MSDITVTANGTVRWQLLTLREKGGEKGQPSVPALSLGTSKVASMDVTE